MPYLWDMTHTHRHKAGEPISHSMFYMWRCVIVVAHADGHVQQEELDYLRRIFGNMDRAYGLSNAQKQLLEDDLVNPKRMGELLPQINDPYYRSQLIYFAGLLAHADGHLHPDEDAILRKLRADQLASLDMEQIRKDVRQAVDDEMFEHEMEINALRPQGFITGALDALLLFMGIDLLGE
jgi:uncharacterized membrane protein YebE (DUF533 family)